MKQQPQNRPDSPAREQQYDDFVLLLTRHDLAIRRFIRSLLPTGDGIDDVLQETALECWRKFSDFQPSDEQNESEEFLRWACVIARFKVLSCQRDKARERLVFRESVVQTLARDAMDVMDHRAQERSAVEACLKKLPDDQQRLVLSVHSPGESIARIAEETGVKTRRLYSKVNVLRTLLLECVQRRLAGETGNG